ncbi:MAG: type I methionyl aminopeptidase [Syntrophobacterales bacterium]|jgi:methionyl aminopeptidase|nr:type I methionyl aminopeptidase [Syntrophobacterales bacterium]
MIILRNSEEIEKIKTASRYAMEILLHVKSTVQEGMKTMDLEAVCEERIKSTGKIRAAFKGYSGYPYCLCVSVNDEVVHGMPGERILKEGDIVSIDFGVAYEGYFGDVALTVGVGKVSQKAERLMKVTEESLYRGISVASGGRRLHDVSHAIQSCVESAGFSVVKEFVGHGIGRSLHEEPQVPNFGEKGTGVRLKKGMVLAIEPMVNIGASDVMIKENGWTVVAKDGGLSAHFEHTVALNENGAEILSAL